MSREYVIIFVTCADHAQAESLAGSVLQQHLAACVNIVDSVISVFHWQSRCERTQEVLLMMKTRRELFEDVRRVIREGHSYDVPEIIAVPIVAGDEAYLDWVAQQTSRD